MDFTQLPRFYRLNHDIADTTFAQLVTVAKLVTRFAGGAFDTSELTGDFLNRFLVARKAAGLAPRTVRGNRTCAMMLWKEAHEIGEAPPVGRVRVVKVPALVPVAFTLDEIRQLIASCAHLRGTFRRFPIRRRIYFESLVECAYDSGLRLGDLLSLERAWIWPGGFLSVVQAKTRNTIRVQLRDTTLAKIDECMADWPGRALIWPQFAERKRLYEYVRRLVKVAGVRPGTLKWIRRSSASYVEAMHPGCGAAHLGHRTSGIAEQFYFDPRIVRPFRPLPPPLDWRPDLPDAG